MFKDVAQFCSSVSRLKLLKFFLLQPESRATAIAVAAVVGVPKNVVQRELRSLARYKILSSRKVGKNILWSVNASHPYAKSLRAFLEMATLPDDSVIVASFRGVSGITLLVAAGTLAGESRGVIDVLVVTKKPKDPRIALAIRSLERTAALPLRYAVLEVKDYAERLEARDRMLRDVLEFSHRIIIGRK